MLAGVSFLLTAAFWDSLHTRRAEATGILEQSAGQSRSDILAAFQDARPAPMPAQVTLDERLLSNSRQIVQSMPEPLLLLEPLAPAPAQDEATPAVQPLAAPLPEMQVSQQAAAPSGTPAETRRIIHDVNITFYDCAGQGFCGAMYNGRKVYEGAAACSWNLPIGTRFSIVGDPTHRIYTCEDRGLLANTWVDIFWYHPSQGYAWQSIVGRHGTIEIISMP